MPDNQQPPAPDNQPVVPRPARKPAPAAQVATLTWFDTLFLMEEKKETASQNDKINSLLVHLQGIDPSVAQRMAAVKSKVFTNQSDPDPFNDQPPPDPFNDQPPPDPFNDQPPPDPFNDQPPPDPFNDQPPPDPFTDQPPLGG